MDWPPRSGYYAEDAERCLKHADDEHRADRATQAQAAQTYALLEIAAQLARVNMELALIADASRGR